MNNIRKSLVDGNIQSAINEARLHIRPSHISVAVDGRNIRFDISPQAESNDETLVLVDVAKFDRLFSKSWQHIGVDGDGQIKTRYADFGVFLVGGEQKIGNRTVTHRPATSVIASEVSIGAGGIVTFGNGRHRYAWLRDHGVRKMPMSMDPTSLTIAAEMGLLHSV